MLSTVYSLDTSTWHFTVIIVETQWAAHFVGVRIRYKIFWNTRCFSTPLMYSHDMLQKIISKMASSYHYGEPIILKSGTVILMIGLLKQSFYQSQNLMLQNDKIMLLVLWKLWLRSLGLRILQHNNKKGIKFSHLNLHCFINLIWSRLFHVDVFYLYPFVTCNFLRLT